MKHQHRSAVLTLLFAGSVAALTACGGSANPSGADVTVTVTPTVTASNPAPSKPATPEVPRSDVRGRAFDFGTIVSATKVGDVIVLELDRWTWKGLDDAKLARQGVPVGPFKGAPPYTNQNAKLTYTIPVTAGARVLQHHCVAADQPLQTKSIGAEELAGLPDRENTVLVTLDEAGRATAAENIPGCPG
jgi:hypothetical protein